MEYRFTRPSGLIAALLAVLWLFPGCSKEKDETGPADSEYFVRFQLNGVQYNLQYEAIGYVNEKTANGSYGGMVAAVASSSQEEKNVLVFLMGAKQPFVTNQVYTNHSTTAPARECDLLDFSGRDSNGERFLSLHETLADLQNISADVKAEFTLITDGQLKGTFSGTVYSDNYTLKRKITNGEFSVKTIN